MSAPVIRFDVKSRWASRRGPHGRWAQRNQGPEEPNTGWRREVDREQLTVDLEQAIADPDQGIKDREQVNLDTEQGDFDRWRTTPRTERDVAVIRGRQTRLDRSQETLERQQEAIDEVQ